MSYNFGFDYVAIMILMLLMIFFWGKRKISLQIYNIYYVMIGSMLLSAIFDVIVNQQNTGISLGGLLLENILVILSIFLEWMIIVSCEMYILSLSNIDIKKSNLWRRMITVPFVIMIALVIASGWTHWVFYIDQNGVLQRGGFYIISDIIEVYYAALTIVIFARFSKTIGFQKIFYILNSLALIFCTYMLQRIYEEQRIFYFVISICMIGLVYSIQRPDEIFDETNALYRDVLLNEASADYISKTPFFMFFIRIHDYKILTDSLGQDSVNEMLSDVTSFLTLFTKGTNVFRIDDNTFAIKKEMMEEDQIESLSRAISQRFKQPWKNGNMKAVLSASFVTAECPKQVPTYDDFVRLVSIIGRKEGTIDTVYSADDMIGGDQEKEILDAIKRGLEQGRFQVYYQPIYSTEKKRIVSAEALVRLFDEKLGFISPEIMIPLAEREGYILEIGKIVFTDVCRFFKENSLTDKGIDYIEVNLSGKQCMQNKLAESFLEIMKEHGLSSSQINFEITESSAMITNNAVVNNINYFEENGVALSLDDYGTGYSNLSYLYQIPFRILKVDKSILWSSESNKKADFTLQSIFDMSKKLGLHVLVEGVETETQITKLLSLGCDYFQGYYFSKPVPGEDFVRYIEEFQLPEVCNA